MLKFVKAVLRFFLVFIFRITVIDEKKALTNSGAILAVNHRSNWDPVIAAVVTPRIMRFMAKSELFKNKAFAALLKKLGAFPVERGKGDIGAIKNSMKLLRDGEMLLIFPEGTRVRNSEESRAKTGAVMIAHRSEVPIIPVYISGEYKWMRKITVKFGDPVSYSEFYGQKLGREELQDLADKLLNTMKSLRV